MESDTPDEFFASPKMKQSLQAFATAVVVDIVNLLGTGVPHTGDSPWLADALDQSGHHLSTRLFDRGVAPIDRGRLDDMVTNGVTMKNLLKPSIVETIALALRLRAIALGVNNPELSCPALSYYAAQTARRQEYAVDSCSSATMRSALACRETGNTEQSWTSGLTLGDVHQAVASHIFTQDRIQSVVTLAENLLLNGADTCDAAIPTAAVLHEMVMGLIRDVRDGLAPSAKALWYDLVLLREHEASFRCDVQFDDSAALFVMPNELSLPSSTTLEQCLTALTGNVTIELGDRGRCVLGPKWAPRNLSPNEVADPPSARYAGERLAESDSEGSTNPPIESSGGTWPHPLRNLNNCGIQVVWRGGTCSLLAAQREIPRLIATATRTAVLSLRGEPWVLSRLRSITTHGVSDDDFYSPRVHREHVVCENIGNFPADFPVRKWIERVVQDGTSDNAPEDSFAGNSCRLFVEADGFLGSNPRQSFVCSMAAIEACLGGVGTDLGKRLGQAFGRLLCPAGDRRPKAIELFERLYDLRSRVVHGAPISIDVRQAVFMRYIASCVAYNFTGFASARKRLAEGSDNSSIRKFLTERDLYRNDILPGTTECEYLLKMLRDDSTPGERWLGRG